MTIYTEEYVEEMLREDPDVIAMEVGIRKAVRTYLESGKPEPTEAEIAAGMEEIRDESRRAARELRESIPKLNDPNEIIGVMKELDALFRPHFCQYVADGQWMLNGFETEADNDSTALYPLVTTLTLNHKSKRGYDQALEWGVSGSEEAMKWLDSINFPFAHSQVKFA